MEREHLPQDRLIHCTIDLSLNMEFAFDMQPIHGRRYSYLEAVRSTQSQVLSHAVLDLPYIKHISRNFRFPLILLCSMFLVVYSPL